MPLKWKVFSPILAGASLKERVLGCVGALLGIGLTGLFSALPFAGPEHLSEVAHWPLIVAPIGASAVLLFAVPASPLAQPWSIIGGNTISALVGVTVARLVPDPALAIGIAVAFAILAMSLTRSLHPPGGAAALTAVIGGAAISRSGYWFPLVPVALNSVLLVAFGIVFHRLAGRNYPHRPPTVKPASHGTADPPPALRVGFNSADIEAAIAALGETFDIARADLDTLLREVELQALMRRKGDLTCADIMSLDVVTAMRHTTPAEARALLLDHDIRTLPVIDADGRLSGTVGLRELAAAEPYGRLPLSPAVTAAPGDPALGLVPSLTGGVLHAVVIVDAALRVEGIISQTDLLAVLASGDTRASPTLSGDGAGI